MLPIVHRPAGFHFFGCSALAQAEHLRSLPAISNFKVGKVRPPVTQTIAAPLAHSRFAPLHYHSSFGLFHVFLT